MDENSAAATNIAQAIAAALDWSSSPESRKAAVAYLESVKTGDIRVLASTSLLLVRKNWSSEIRLHGFKMLQHLVRLRWGEFNRVERRNFANASLELIAEMANAREEWALKSQTAALVAEVIRREGLTLWQELLPSLVSLANKGPVEAELVVMMLRWLPEDITVHNEDLEGDRRRLLLRGLTQSLPEILPLLYALLDKHFGAALTEVGRQQIDVAKQHSATVTATLNAVNAYAEWAPVPDLSKYGLIHGCGILLSSVEFRLHACEFFKLISPRKRPLDDTLSEFDSAMNNIFEILMSVSGNILCSHAGGVDDGEFEFAECICECMVSLGTSHLQCIAGNNTIIPLYIQQMLGYFQHFKLALHYQSLAFWLVILRELVSKMKLSAETAGDNSAVNNLASGSGQAEKEKKGVPVVVDDDICGAILDVSFQRMLKKNVQLATHASVGTFELWSDDFDGKGDFSQYRSRLLEIIRLIAVHKPIVAAVKVSQRVDSIIKSQYTSPLPAKDLALLESMQLALETIVSAIFDGTVECGGYSSEIQFGMQSLLEQLFSLKWSEPELCETLARYLDALGPFLKCFPEAAGAVINKIFELLASLPFTLKDPSSARARLARLQICTSFIRIAKTAGKSLLPHMKEIGDTMGYLQGEGRLLRGEHNLLGEAFLVMASAVGTQQQQEVLVWLLEPLSKQWMQVDWQNAYLSDPLGLVHLCLQTDFMWSLFHTVTFFEKALKRSGTGKGNYHLQNGIPHESSAPLHPMASHLSWMLPPLLRMLRSIHSLWSQPITQALPVQMRVAMSMSHVEQASLLGESYSKQSKSAASLSDGPQAHINKEGSVEASENVRNWLKGIRESGYNVLGLSATIGDSFFRCLDSSAVALALMENIQSMDFRHIRQLTHLVLIPMVKSCPADLWEEWLEKLLQPLFFHCQQTLSCSWSGLLHEGRAKVPDTYLDNLGLGLKVEVMEEKLLRDLTREICLLLSIMASPVLNRGLPSLEQLVHANRTDMSFLNDLNAFVSNSQIGFLLNHKGLALPALQVSVEAFTWTDSDSVSKVASFCSAVILLASATNAVELRQFVAKDLFLAIIQGLALESNAIISADLIALCREIFVYLSDRDPAPRQVLLSLPCIAPSDLKAFEDAVAVTSSPKEQKQHMRSLLLLATGNQLRALAAQKTTNVITNVSNKVRVTTSTPDPDVEGDDRVGLAAIT